MFRKLSFAIFIFNLIISTSLLAENLSPQDLNNISNATNRFLLMQNHFERFYPDQILKKLCDKKEVLTLRLINETNSNGDYVVYIDRLFTSLRFNKDFLTSPNGWGFYGYPGNSYYSDLIAKYPGGLKFNMQMINDNYWNERKRPSLDLIQKLIAKDAQGCLDEGSYIYISKVSEKMPWIYFYDPKNEYFFEYLYDFNNEKVITSDINNAGAHPVIFQEAAFVMQDNCIYKYENKKIVNINLLDKFLILMQKTIKLLL